MPCPSPPDRPRVPARSPKTGMNRQRQQARTTTTMAGEHHHNGWENQRCAVKVGTTPRDLPRGTTVNFPKKSWVDPSRLGGFLVALGRPVKKEFSATQAFIRSLNLTSSPVPQTGCRLQNRALRAKKSISTTYQRFRLHTRPHSPLRPALHVLQRHPTRRGRLAHKVVVALLSGHTQNIREGAKRSRERARLKITATVYSPKRSNTRV